MNHFEAPIAIYARYSTDLQNERSCEDQVIGCKQYIERQDDLRGRPTELFTDNAISGSFIINRPSMMRLLGGIWMMHARSRTQYGTDVREVITDTSLGFAYPTLSQVPTLSSRPSRANPVREQNKQV